MNKKLIIALLIAGLGVAAAVGAWWMRGADERLFSALEADERPAGAIDRLRKIVASDPDNLNAQQWLLRIEIESGKVSEAQNRLNLLQVKAPDYYGTVANACLLYLHNRHAQKAARNCERAVELSGRSVEDLNRLASAYLMIPDFIKALPVLQEAERKAPDNLKVQNNLGYYFILVSIPEEAVRVLKAVVAKDPKFLEARKNLARAYYENKQYQESAAEVEIVLRDEPYNKDLLTIMALIQVYHFRDKPKANEYARRAIAAGMDKQRAEALFRMMRSNEPTPVRRAGPPPLPTPHPVGPARSREMLSPPALPGPGAEGQTSGGTADPAAPAPAATPSPATGATP